MAEYPYSSVVRALREAAESGPFTRADVQAYADLMLAGGKDYDEIEKALRKRFGDADITLSPAGQVIVPSLGKEHSPEQDMGKRREMDDEPDLDDIEQDVDEDDDGYEDADDADLDDEEDDYDDDVDLDDEEDDYDDDDNADDVEQEEWDEEDHA